MNSLILKQHLENSLAVQGLGLGAPTAGAWVRSLVGELRSHKPRDAAKKKKKINIWPFLTPPSIDENQGSQKKLFCCATLPEA